MRKRKFHRPGGAEAYAEAGAEAYAAACPSHGRDVFFSRAGDYQIAPKPPGGRLWVVAVLPPEKAFIHGVSW